MAPEIGRGTPGVVSHINAIFLCWTWECLDATPSCNKCKAPILLSWWLSQLYRLCFLLHMKSLDPQLAQQFQHGRLVRHSLSLAYRHSATPGGQICSSIQLNMRMAHGLAGAVGVAKDYSHMVIWPVCYILLTLWNVSQHYVWWHRRIDLAYFIYVRPPGPVRLQPAVLWPCHHL